MLRARHVWCDNLAVLLCFSDRKTVRVLSAVREEVREKQIKNPNDI